MHTHRKSYKEIQLQKQIQELKIENARLKDCVLLQQKILEKQKKQKQECSNLKSIIKEEYQMNFQQHPSYFQIVRSRKNSQFVVRQSKLLKCLSSKVLIQYNSLQQSKYQKLCSTNNDSRKATQNQIHESQKNGKSKKKLLTAKDLKSFNFSSSLTNLSRIPSFTNEINTRRKSYLQKLAQQISPF